MNEKVTVQNKKYGSDTFRNSTQESSARNTIPRPLIQANRAFLIVTVALGLLIHPLILVLPLGVGIIALGTRKHPVIAFGRRFLRNPANTYRLEDRADQRFNQWIATVLIGLSGGAFLVNQPIPGYIFGGMVILAATVAFCGFCIGCYIRYQYQQWKYRATEKRTTEKR